MRGCAPRSSAKAVARGSVGIGLAAKTNDEWREPTSPLIRARPLRLGTSKSGSAASRAAGATLQQPRTHLLSLIPLGRFARASYVGALRHARIIPHRASLAVRGVDVGPSRTPGSLRSANRVLQSSVLGFLRRSVESNLGSCPRRLAAMRGRVQTVPVSRQYRTTASVQQSTTRVPAASLGCVWGDCPGHSRSRVGRGLAHGRPEVWSGGRPEFWPEVGSEFDGNWGASGTILLAEKPILGVPSGVWPSSV